MLTEKEILEFFEIHNDGEFINVINKHPKYTKTVPTVCFSSILDDGSFSLVYVSPAYRNNLLGKDINRMGVYGAAFLQRYIDQVNFSIKTNDNGI